MRQKFNDTQSVKITLPSGVKIYQSIVGNRALRRLHKTRSGANLYAPLVVARYARLKAAWSG